MSLMQLTDQTILVTDTFVRPSDLGVSFELMRRVPGRFEFERYIADSLDEVIAAANSIGAKFIVTRHSDLLSHRKYKKISIITPEAYLQLNDHDASLMPPLNRLID
jgi:hypothetical protein